VRYEYYINRNSKGVNTTPNEYINYNGIDYRIRERFSRPYPNDKKYWLRLLDESNARMRSLDKTIDEEEAEEPKWYIKKK
jgi:hypothetical protein